MATSASQPYIAKLGFQDKDRSTERHGLACEYLFHRLIEMEVAPRLNQYRRDYLTTRVEESQRHLDAQRKRVASSFALAKERPSSSFIEANLEEAKQNASAAYEALQEAILDRDAFTSSWGLNQAHELVKPAYAINQPIKQRSYVVGFADVLINVHNIRLLGEVKITPQSSESILQQINFYETHLRESGLTYILTDFDCSDLQRMAEGTHIKVYRLGRRFEQWLAQRATFQSDEL
jgi:hypothetical protein